MKLQKRRQTGKALKLYAGYYQEAYESITELLLFYRQKNYDISIWGAGLKGQAFLSIFDKDNRMISCVYDIDKKKHETVMETGHRICSCGKEDNRNRVILLMNGNYEAEVLGILKECGHSGGLVNMDSFVEGRLTVQDLLEMSKMWEKPLRKEKIGIAALVILFHPGRKQIDNILSYYEDADIIYAYDNSERPDQAITEELKQMEKVCYLPGNGNRGIARAVNEAAQRAVEDGYRWLITFDQDSRAGEQMLLKMKEFLLRYPSAQKIGILCPGVCTPIKAFGAGSNTFSYCKWVQQSGALHNLDAYLPAGNYDESLFIDQVDYEYCLRLLQKGYQIIRLNDAVLLHNIEDTQTEFRRVKGHPLYINKYPPVRYYYNVRNILYCTNKYKDNRFYVETQRRNLKSLLMTLPYEKEKRKKCIAALAGLWDYKTGKMGKTRRGF